MALALRQFSTKRPRPAIRWSLVALFAVVLAYSDGFWLTALQGAIGAIERLEEPFERWLRDATLMLPLFFVAVLLAVLVARRPLERLRGEVARLAVVCLLVALMAGALGLAEAGVSSYRDYRMQSTHLVKMQTGGLGDASLVSTENSPVYVLYCNLRGATATDPLAMMEYATLMVHAKALALFSVVLLVNNLALVGLLMVFIQDRLWSSGGAQPT